MHRFTAATAVYIGKIARPIKGVSKGMEEDDDEDAHLVNGAKQEIQFIHSDPNHQFMVGTTLQQNQGVTYELLKDLKKGT